MWKRILWISAAVVVLGVVGLTTAGWLFIRQHSTLTKVAEVIGPDGSASHELWHARNGDLELRRRDGSVIGSIRDYYSDVSVVRTNWRANGSVELVTSGGMKIEFKADGTGNYASADSQ